MPSSPVWFPFPTQVSNDNQILDSKRRLSLSFLLLLLPNTSCLVIMERGSGEEPPFPSSTSFANAVWHAFRFLPPLSPFPIVRLSSPACVCVFVCLTSVHHTQVSYVLAALSSSRSSLSAFAALFHTFRRPLFYCFDQSMLLDVSFLSPLLQRG